MPCATIVLTLEGRKGLGVVLASMLTIQTVIGLSILGCGIYFLRNLQWRMMVICHYDTYTLAVCIVVVGGLIAFLSFGAAKIFYDSGKEETRDRFVFLLFPLIIFFIGLLIVEFALAISCKVHHDFDIEAYRSGFITAIENYLEDPVTKENLDRLQSEDECCGGDGFKDWLETDWVSDQFNPLLNPNLPPYERSIYYPWKISSPPEEPHKHIANMQPPPSLVVNNHQHAAPNDNIDQNKPHNVYPPNYEPHGHHHQPPPEVDLPELDGFSRMPRRVKRFKDTKERLNRRAIRSRGKRSKMDSHLWVVPWSCCSVHFSGPCIHDYVVQRYMVHELQAKVAWDGSSLYQQGCAPLLKTNYNLYCKASVILFCLAFVNQLIILICARYLQTSVESVDLYNRENRSSDGYLLPCNWCGGGGGSLNKHKLRESRQGRNPENESIDEEAYLIEKAQRFTKKNKRRLKKRVSDPLQYRRQEFNVEDDDAEDDDGNDKDDEKQEKLLLLKNKRKHKSHHHKDKHTKMKERIAQLLQSDQNTKQYENKEKTEKNMSKNKDQLLSTKKTKKRTDDDDMVKQKKRKKSNVVDDSE